MASKEAILKAGAQAVQQVDGGLVEGAGEQGDPALGGAGEQRRVPLVGRLGLGVEVVQAAAVPQPAGDAELRPVDVHGDGVGGVGLDLDGVAAGGRRRVDHAERPLQAAVVVPRQLADDIGRMARADLAVGDLDLGRHVLPASSTGVPASKFSTTFCHTAWKRVIKADVGALPILTQTTCGAGLRVMAHSTKS